MTNAINITMQESGENPHVHVKFARNQINKRQLTE